MKKQERRKEKGITLVALVITIVILIILATITVNFLFGENGLITMAQKAKDQYEEAAKNEEQQLAGIFGKNFADYNGQLHVEDGKLLNQYDETAVLRGMSAGNGKGIESLTERYYNKESLSVIKNWGANVLRIPVDTDPYYQGYVSNPDIINRVFEIVDICIELDMYVIIDWHVLYEGNPNTYVDQAKGFFSQVATKYKDIPNILYEICNEPNGDDVTWEVIKNYANEVIPVIRNIDSDSIIIVGTPSWCHNVDEVINNTLEYNNIMYTVHFYSQNYSYNYTSRIEKAIAAGIPIFITEFGVATENQNTDRLCLEVSNMFANYMKGNNISWCNWTMSEGESLEIVQQGKWNNNLNDNILNESGKYIKQLLLEKDLKNYSIMMRRLDNYAFWSDEYRNNITNIIIEDSINYSKINNSIKSWNVSLMNSYYNNVIAYIYNDENADGKYILYIAGEGQVYTPFYSDNLFASFSSLKNIDITNLNTMCTISLRAMLAYNYTLEQIIGLDKIKMTYVTNTQQMFENLIKIKKIDLSNVDFSNVTTYTDMFNNINEGITIIVKDEDSKNFIQSRLDEVGSTAEIQISEGEQE